MKTIEPKKQIKSTKNLVSPVSYRLKPAQIKVIDKVAKARGEGKSESLRFIINFFDQEYGR